MLFYKLRFYIIGPYLQTLIFCEQQATHTTQLPPEKNWHNSCHFICPLQDQTTAGN